LVAGLPEPFLAEAKRIPLGLPLVHAREELPHRGEEDPFVRSPIDSRCRTPEPFPAEARRIPLYGPYRQVPLR